MATENNDIRKLDESAGFHPETNFIIKLSIKDVEVPSASIVDVVLREWIFDALPRLEIMISDNGRYIDQFPLEDNDKIVIELNHFIFDKPPINAQFKLQDYEIVNSAPGKSQQGLLKITALLDTDNFTFPIQIPIVSFIFPYIPLLGPIFPYIAFFEGTNPLIRFFKKLVRN